MTRPARPLRLAGPSLTRGRSVAAGIVGVGSLVLAASCTDSQTVTGPAARSQEPSLITTHHAPVVGDVVLMHRTTQVAARDGRPKVNRSFTEKIGGEVRRTGKEELPALLPTRPDFAAGVLPRPVVSLPARAELGICGVLPAWSREERTPDGHKVTVAGSGDAPASVVTVVADDGTVLTIERTWVRTSRTWQLARQLTTTSDKRYRDDVVYEHQSASGNRIDGALPTVACADTRGPGLISATASREFYLPHISTVASRLFPLSEGGTAYSCGDSGDNCFTQQNSVYTADVTLAAAATIAAYACSGAAIIVPAACVAAGVAWAAAVANLALAQRALNYCLTHPGGVIQPVAAWGAVANPQTLSAMTTSASRLPSLPPRVSADCTGGDTGGGTIQCHSEEWEISYDGGATWSYLTTINVCENVL